MGKLFFSDGRELALNSIFCIGRNYAEHIEELGNERPDAPVVFDKPAAALLHDGGTITLPKGSEDVHYETEVVVALASGGRDLSQEEARQAIAGYAVGLDLTARDWQSVAKAKGLPWTLCKGFDGAACVSTFLPVDECPEPQALSFSMWQNGELRQQGETKMMLFPIAELIAYISEYCTLSAGDIIYTGTPVGVGPLAAGDHLRLNLLDKISATFEVSAS
ncbi:fumarylacetoacetate hydrolase family protein [Suttonella sp. R2A3]|uniref:fumarylacetoacetate hydrolase family protein n=1 Tax=Suttonella sp. R2A3 TaxID=2908648 RepID=UPI001F47C3DF|nr:fumarylacetoacetate hydrolase family protein [Suttonella sp. R2A3]UJF24021.1 fumarylacetoacetate hydrolase family protein [Suttonella sp. R2A3]